MDAKKEIFLKKFGRNLQKIRRKKHITQEQLANTLDLEISQISRIERGIINTSVYNTSLIAEALSLHPKDLLDFD